MKNPEEAAEDLAGTIPEKLFAEFNPSSTLRTLVMYFRNPLQFLSEVVGGNLAGKVRPVPLCLFAFSVYGLVASFSGQLDPRWTEAYARLSPRDTSAVATALGASDSSFSGVSEAIRRKTSTRLHFLTFSSTDLANDLVKSGHRELANAVLATQLNSYSALMWTSAPFVWLLSLPILVWTIRWLLRRYSHFPRLTEVCIYSFSAYAIVSTVFALKPSLPLMTVLAIATFPAFFVYLVWMLRRLYAVPLVRLCGASIVGMLLMGFSGNGFRKLLTLAAKTAGLLPPGPF